MIWTEVSPAATVRRESFSSPIINHNEVSIRKLKQVRWLPRLLMVVAVLGLMSLFVFPMWNITLFAPQYPAGVTMHIHINKIGGDSPSTIQNINILNHYVGMKYIEPESIPELKFFPYIIGAMGVLGAIAIVINRKWGYLAWGILLILLSIAGFYDFYLWLYEYGHNLSPDAPIKVPGATYQPPLIGTKTILNFTAVSLPNIGGWLAGVAVVSSLLAGYLKPRKSASHA